MAKTAELGLSLAHTHSLSPAPLCSLHASQLSTVTPGARPPAKQTDAPLLPLLPLLCFYLFYIRILIHIQISVFNHYSNIYIFKFRIFVDSPTAYPVEGVHGDAVRDVELGEALALLSMDPQHLQICRGFNTQPGQMAAGTQSSRGCKDVMF